MPVWLIGVLSSFGTWIVERLGKWLFAAGAFGVAYVGADLLVNRIFRSMVASIGGGLSAAYDILLMAGFGTALNIMLSASAFALAIAAGKGAAE